MTYLLVADPDRARVTSRADRSESLAHMAAQ